jgi:Tfp pilus assembly protein PilV
MRRNRRQHHILAGQVCRTPKRAGSLLLELIVAVFVLALVVIPASQYVTNALRAGDKTQASVRAALLCESRLNEILAQETVAWQNSNGTFDSTSDYEWEFTISAMAISSLQRASMTVRSRSSGRILAEQVVFVRKPGMKEPRT